MRPLPGCLLHSCFGESMQRALLLCCKAGTRLWCCAHPGLLPKCASVVGRHLIETPPMRTAGLCHASLSQSDSAIPTFHISTAICQHWFPRRFRSRSSIRNLYVSHTHITQITHTRSQPQAVEECLGSHLPGSDLRPSGLTTASLPLYLPASHMPSYVRVSQLTDDAATLSRPSRYLLCAL